MDTFSLVQLAVAVVLPALVALVTKEVTSSAVKGFALAALAGAAGFGKAYLDGKGVVTEAALTDSVTIFVVSVVTYYGLLKPAHIPEKIQSKTPDFGI